MRQIMKSRSSTLLAGAVLMAAVWPLSVARAEQWSGCFVGSDLAGGQAFAAVGAERYSDWFEIMGQIQSTGMGRVYNFKADGHSGAGRLYVGHEYEAGAVYVQILDLSDRHFALEVEGHGVLRLERTSC